jgi:hypothetical protein
VFEILVLCVCDEPPLPSHDPEEMSCDMSKLRVR